MISTHKYHATREQIQAEEVQIKAAIKDPKRFATIYEKYYLQIFKYVYQRVNSEEDAADITSQVFVKAMVNLKKYQFRGLPFSSWLYRVAQNELNQLFRKNKYKRTINAKTEQLHELIEETEDDRYPEQMQQVTKAMRALNPNDMELIEMRFFEQRSFKEIGEIADMTENNAKVKTFRALQKLKRLIAKK